MSTRANPQKSTHTHTDSLITSLKQIGTICFTISLFTIPNFTFATNIPTTNPGCTTTVLGAQNIAPARHTVGLRLLPLQRDHLLRRRHPLFPIGRERIHRADCIRHRSDDTRPAIGLDFCVQHGHGEKDIGEIPAL